jgi:hypothetical protein
MDAQPKLYSARKTREEWKHLVADAEQSSIPAVTYCEQQGLSYQSFMKWRSTFRSEENQSKKQFLEITPNKIKSSPEPCSQGWDVELALGGDIVLRIRRVK